MEASQSERQLSPRGMKLGRELSPYQLETLQCAARGLTARQTAEALGKTEISIERAWQVVRAKLGAATIAEAAVIGRAEGYSIPYRTPRRRKPAPVPAPAEHWVRDWERGDEYIEHWRGLAWHVAPIPPADHNCLPRTRGTVRISGMPLMRISRCACGAVDVGDGWEDRFSRSA